jgi:hypothetical protein
MMRVSRWETALLAVLHGIHTPRRAFFEFGRPD